MKQRYINTKFWSDNWIQKLDPIEKFLFMYLLTNEKTNIAGIYELPIKIMAVETGIDEDTIKNIFKRFQKVKKVYFIDGWIILPNFPKHQKWQDNAKIQRGIEIILEKLPDIIRYSIDTLSIPYTYPSNNTNTNYNTNTNKDRVSDLFNSFYSSYPKKKAKSEAEKAWKKLKPDNFLLQVILKDIEKKKKSDQWQRGNGQYIPYPATYLNQRRWEDEETKTANDGYRLR